MLESMEHTPVAVEDADGTTVPNGSLPAQNESFSQASHNSQTAAEFINTQLQLEADAREALPYTFDNCTQPLGALRQILFSCLTCNPPPASPSDPYTPAAVCYSCSIACHGKHELVELFHKRGFTCDCGTTRLPATSPCTLRINPATGVKGPVHSEIAAPGNTYNQNFRNKFCGCQQVYDAHTEKGTMYQCLSLATEAEGGCGEDWWHPECLLGLPRDWFEHAKEGTVEAVVKEEDGNVAEDVQENEERQHPSPLGFPDEDDFVAFICYKCVELNPWIKRYADSQGFLPPVFYKPERQMEDKEVKVDEENNNAPLIPSQPIPDSTVVSRKRRADDESDTDSSISKKPKLDSEGASTPPASSTCHYSTLPPSSTRPFSLFLGADFRSRFCRCPSCYPTLSKHRELLEEEAIYEPPLSEDGDNGDGGGSIGTGSLLDRGEAALSNVDRVRAIEGVMVYNHLKDKVKAFLQPFAESGQAVGAEDIKAYFETLRGDAEAIRAAGGAAVNGGGEDGPDGDERKEQSGY